MTTPIQQYSVVTADNVDQLLNGMTELMEKGWEPFGPPQHWDDGEQQKIVQALVQYDRTTEATVIDLLTNLHEQAKETTRLLDSIETELMSTESAL